MGMTASLIMLMFWGYEEAPPTWSAGPVVFGLSRWWSGCRRDAYSAVTSATAALALDWSTIALLAA
jgi:hypothetical protein